MKKPQARNSIVNPPLILESLGPVSFFYREVPMLPVTFDKPTWPVATASGDSLAPSGTPASAEHCFDSRSASSFDRVRGQKGPMLMCYWATASVLECNPNFLTQPVKSKELGPQLLEKLLVSKMLCLWPFIFGCTCTSVFFGARFQKTNRHFGFDVSSSLPRTSLGLLAVHLASPKVLQKHKYIISKYHKDVDTHIYIYMYFIYRYICVCKSLSLSRSLPPLPLPLFFFFFFFGP